MLGSDYRELIVPKLDNKSKRTAILIGGIAGVILLAAASFVISPLILLLAAGAAAATWYFVTANRIEYEYVISGDELVITKIIAESRRKHLLTVSIMQFDAFGRLADAPPIAGSQTLAIACSAQDSSTYYADFDHEEFGQTRLLITPDENILTYFDKKLPRRIGFSYGITAQSRC